MGPGGECQWGPIEGGKERGVRTQRLINHSCIVIDFLLKAVSQTLNFVSVCVCVVADRLAAQTHQLLCPALPKGSAPHPNPHPTTFIFFQPPSPFLPFFFVKPHPTRSFKLPRCFVCIFEHNNCVAFNYSCPVQRADEPLHFEPKRRGLLVVLVVWGEGEGRVRGERPTGNPL